MKKTMYDTEIQNIRNAASSTPIVLLEGPRGTGKTAMARQAFPLLNFIDLDDPKVRALAGRSPRTFLLAFPQGAVINEVSRVPGLLDSVRYYVDRRGANVRYILTSSLSPGTDDMGGRLSTIRTAGLSATRMEAEKLSVYNPFQVIHQGQLNEVLYGTRSCADIIEECLALDIAGHINASNLGLFRIFLSALARQSGRRLSMNAAARETGISSPTAKSWLSLVLSYNLARIAGDPDDNGRLVFLTDTGILCHLLGIETWKDLVLNPMRDNVVRTYAFNELVRGRFSRKAEAGIVPSPIADFKANWKERFSIIVDPNLDVTEEKADLARRVSCKSRKAVVLYLGDVTYSMGTLDCISFMDWTKLSSEVNYFS